MSFSFVNLTPGDPAPWFRAPSTTMPRFAFDTIAGRYVVLCFLGSAGDEQARRTLRSIAENRATFDDARCTFLGVTVDPKDQTEGRVVESLPGVRFIIDGDGAVSRLYGAMPREPSPDGRLRVRRMWMVLDPTLRVMKVVSFAADGSDVGEVFGFLAELPPVDRFAGIGLQAPVLYLPNVFEADFCRRLIDIYEAEGGKDSGFMREIDGKTQRVSDHGHKKRSDCTITDETLIREARGRILRRVVPEIGKAFQFKATRMERYIVGCYTAEDGGHFRPHRDNTTGGTAHRRFAISINLNSGFSGGEVSFPEYGPRSFKPAPGGAVVFSCSLLHAVSRVTEGKRYAFLPFVYDEAAAKLREQNNANLEETVGAYRPA